MSAFDWIALLVVLALVGAFAAWLYLDARRAHELLEAAEAGSTTDYGVGPIAPPMLVALGLPGYLRKEDDYYRGWKVTMNNGKVVPVAAYRDGMLYVMWPWRGVPTGLDILFLNNGAYHSSPDRVTLYVDWTKL